MTRELPLWAQDRTYPAARDRRVISSMWGQAGVVSGGTPSLATLTVTVTPFLAVVPGAAAGQGSYLVESTSPQAIAFVRPASSARITTIVARVRDPLFGDGGANTEWVLEPQYGALGAVDPGLTGSAVPVAGEPALTGSSLALVSLFTPATGTITVIDRRRAALARGGVPVGTVLPTTAGNLPEGWVLCHGQAISRSTCWAYWNEVGATFGGGDGSTTVNVPDLRGRDIFGRDDMGGVDSGRLPTANTRGASGGAASVVLSTANMPAHAHGGATGATGAHSHGGGTGAAGTHAHSASQDAHRHGVGGDMGFRFMVTAGSTIGAPAGAPNTIAATSMDLAQPAVSVAPVGDHAHAIGSDGNHAHTITAEGSGTAVSILPPHMVLDFMVRVA